MDLSKHREGIRQALMEALTEYMSDAAKRYEDAVEAEERLVDADVLTGVEISTAVYNEKVKAIQAMESMARDWELWLPIEVHEEEGRILRVAVSGG